MRKELTDFSNWTMKEYLTIGPIVGGILLILFVLIVSGGDVGVAGVTIMFTLLVGASPYFLWNYLRIKKVKEIEDQMPNFLRDLVESVRGGMSLDLAIKNATNADYGRLTTEIKKMYYQLTWGIPFEKTLMSFSKRLHDSDLIVRSVKIIMEARKSGGDILSVMETVASDVATIKETEKDRRSSTSKQVMVMYIIYFMFIGIVITLSKILVPITNLSVEGGGASAVLGGGGGPCVGQLSGFSGVVCSFFLASANIFGMGTGSEGYYKSLFMFMILIQGILSGLIAGQIGEDSVYAGAKHSLILTGIGFSIFMIALKAGLI